LLPAPLLLLLLLLLLQAVIGHFHGGRSPVSIVLNPQLLPPAVTLQLLPHHCCCHLQCCCCRFFSDTSMVDNSLPFILNILLLPSPMLLLVLQVFLGHLHG
jgi:hypothetical protein